jgi:deoxyribonuclease V
MEARMAGHAEPDAQARESLRRRLTSKQAEDVQLALAERVRTRGIKLTEVHTVAGAAAVSANDKIFAAAVLLAFPTLEMIARSTVQAMALMPYVSGLRAFRDGQALAAAIEGLNLRPDVVFFRGHGIAHPRGCGLASHLGLALGIATIGCAQRMIGAQASLSAGEPGDCAPLVDDRGRQVGAVVVTRRGSRPLLVSVGHLIDLGTATALALTCSRGHALPEPLRLAAAEARAARTQRER